MEVTLEHRRYDGFICHEKFYSCCCRTTTTTKEWTSSRPVRSHVREGKLPVPCDPTSKRQHAKASAITPITHRGFLGHAVIATRGFLGSTPPSTSSYQRHPEDDACLFTTDGDDPTAVSRTNVNAAITSCRPEEDACFSTNGDDSRRHLPRQRRRRHQPITLSRQTLRTPPPPLSHARSSSLRRSLRWIFIAPPGGGPSVPPPTSSPQSCSKKSRFRKDFRNSLSSLQ